MVTYRFFSPASTYTVEGICVAAEFSKAIFEIYCCLVCLCELEPSYYGRYADWEVEVL